MVGWLHSPDATTIHQPNNATATTKQANATTTPIPIAKLSIAIGTRARCSGTNTVSVSSLSLVAMPKSISARTTAFESIVEAMSTIATGATESAGLWWLLLIR
jgi:hypothetical protein